MKLSQRVGRIGESATLKVSRRAGELRRAGVDVLDLGAGEPDFPSPQVAVDRACSALMEGATKYTDASGIVELREALAERYAAYGAPWTAADTMVTCGAKMGLFHFALALLEEGDEAVLPAPYWVSFPEQFRLAGAEPVAVPTSGADGFRVHAGPLIEAFTERTRMVLINSPSNPTGGIIGADDLRRLAEACAERGIVLVSDETYERFLYDGAEHATVAALAAEFPDTVVLVGSFSKTYAMTGWRLGYCMGPKGLMAAARRLQSHSTSNPTTFAMHGGLTALTEAEPEVEKMIAEYQLRRDLLVPRLNQLPGFKCQPPAGAFYAFPDVSACYRPGRQGSIELAEYLLEKASVAVVPGIAFGNDDCIRISFACSRATLDLALERMAEALGD